MNRKSGVTLIELVVILVIMGVIAGIGVFLIGNTINHTQLEADQATVRSLNSALSLYLVGADDTSSYFDALTDEERISILYETGYLSIEPVVQSSEGEYIFDEDTLTWRLEIGDEIIPLSPFGDTFEEISTAFIDLIHDYFLDNGTYGRTWGDYRYTDLGLEPDDWDEPIQHIYYTPSGSTLKVKPEAGYEFVVYTPEDEMIVLKSTTNYSLIYSDLDELWYYYSISEENVIDITTLEVRLT